MNIDIQVKTSGTELPELKPGQMRYVVASNGTFLERATPMFTSSVLLDDPPPGIEPHHKRCVLNIDPMPVEMVAQMAGFFREAYELHGGEAALILLYHPMEKRFEWYCPVQTIEFHFSYFYQHWYAGDSIEYDNPLELPPGAIQFGDAHSHHGSPNPSWIDKLDESHQDGFHIILGNVTGNISWHIDFAIDGTRFAVPPQHIFADIPEPPYPQPPREWMEQIRIVKIGEKSHTTEENNRDSESSDSDSDSDSSGSSHSTPSNPSNQSLRKSDNQLDCDRNYGSYPHKGGSGYNRP